MSKVKVNLPLSTKVNNCVQNRNCLRSKCRFLQGNFNCQAGRISNSWGKFKSLSTPRLAATSVVLCGKLYVIGGIDSRTVSDTDNEKVLKSVEVYCPKTNSWRNVAPMNTKRAFSMSGVICGKIYVVGGENKTDKKQALTTGEVYCPRLNKWTPIANMKIPREGGVAGVICHRLYVVGGSSSYQDRNDKPAVGLSSGEIYDPKTNSWWPMASMKNPRIDAMAQVICDRLYVLGGADKYGGPGEVYYRSAEVYHPKTNTWTQIAKMPKPIAFASAGVINQMLFIVGGYNSVDMVLKSGFRYDPKTNSWEKIADLSKPRVDGVTGVICNRLYFVGGVENVSDFKSLPFGQVYY